MVRDILILINGAKCGIQRAIKSGPILGFTSNLFFLNSVNTSLHLPTESILIGGLSWSAGFGAIDKLIHRIKYQTGRYIPTLFIAIHGHRFVFL